MLAVRRLTVRYGALAAVDGVSLEIADGGVLALLGPSGCGKSTLLRAIAGIEPAASGSVSWDGVDLARIPVHRRGFGLMFQDGVLFPHRTVAGNIGYGLPAGGRRARADPSARVAELLDLVGLAGYRDRRVATLSGGEAQRVALARALAPRPRLLLLDEPLAALDSALRDQLLVDLASVLTTTGTTAVFVTHDHGEAFAIADKVALMRAGRIVQCGAPQQLWRFPVDAWAARFLGCRAVVRGRPRSGAHGGWLTDTAVGSVVGRATWVGLRPEALVVDPEGAIRARVVNCVSGPDRHRLTVRLRGRPGIGDPGAGLGLVDDGALGEAVFPAIAPSGPALRPDQPVRLRFAPEHAALIGADTADEPLVIVAAAVLRGGELLVARRTAPRELAGRWELPGGKVEPGESEAFALARELAEELGIAVSVGARLGPTVPLGDGPDGRPWELRVFAAELRRGAASPSVHDAVRWVGPDDLDGLDWVPADRQLVPALRAALGAGARHDNRVG